MFSPRDKPDERSGRGDSADDPDPFPRCLLFGFRRRDRQRRCGFLRRERLLRKNPHRRRFLEFWLFSRRKHKRSGKPDHLRRGANVANLRRVNQHPISAAESFCTVQLRCEIFSHRPLFWSCYTYTSLRIRFPYAVKLHIVKRNRKRVVKRF